MVTRSVIRISAEEKAALDANANKHHENDLLLEDEHKRLDDANDEDIDPIISSGDLDCDTSLCLPPTLPPLPPLDIEVAQEASLEITQQDNDKKRRRDAQNEGERDKKKRKKIDLSDVSEQPLIRSKRKGGSSQFRGVSFKKATRKWRAVINMDRKLHYIGCYDNEEEAAIDYARAFFKLRGGSKQQGKELIIDLTDVPKQPPIKKEKKDSSSQYKGVSFDKARKKWVAKIMIDRKEYHIDRYDNEEEAGSAYATAVFKYKKGNAEDNSRQNKLIDLTGVPKQLPIKSKRKGTSSQYEGVCFCKRYKKWMSVIKIDGKNHTIGRYDNEEQAAIDYARAVFKYKGANNEDSSRQNKLIIDLTDVPKQLPIKSGKKGSSSQYKGVTFNKRHKKWRAGIQIGGKRHSIGYYDDEEEAGIDYICSCRVQIQRIKY